MWWPGRLSTSLGEHHASRATHRECAHTAQYAWRAAEGLSGGAGTLNVVVSIRASELLIARTGAGMGMSCRFLGRGRVVMMMAAHVKQLGGSEALARAEPPRAESARRGR